MLVFNFLFHLWTGRGSPVRFLTLLVFHEQKEVEKHEPIPLVEQTADQRLLVGLNHSNSLFVGSDITWETNVCLRLYLTLSYAPKRVGINQSLSDYT